MELALGPYQPWSEREDQLRDRWCAKREEYRSGGTELYNLRQLQTYRRRGSAEDRTRPVKVAIGERRKPRPEGRPGFLRVDSLHQGNLRMG